MNDNARSRKPSPYLTLMRQDRDLYLADLQDAVVATISDLSDPPGEGQKIIQQKASLRDAIVRDLRQRSLVGPSEIWTAFRERSQDVKDPRILRSVSNLLFSIYAKQVAVRIAYKQRKSEETTVTRNDRLEVLRRSVVEQLGQSRTNAGKGDWNNVLIKGTETESRKILNGIKKGYFSVPGEGSRLDGEDFIRKYPHLFPEPRGYNSKRGIAAVFGKAFDDANALSTAVREVEWELIAQGSYDFIYAVFADDPEQGNYLLVALNLMKSGQGVTEADIRTAVKTVFDAEEESMISKIKLAARKRDHVLKLAVHASDQNEKNRYVGEYDNLASKSNQEVRKFEQFSLEKTGKMNRLLAVLLDIHKDPSADNVYKMVNRSLPSGKKAAAPLRVQNAAEPSIEALPEEKRTVLKQTFGRALNAGMQTKLATEERQELSSLLEAGNAFFNLASSPLVQTLKKSFNVEGGFTVESVLNDFFGKPTDKNEKIRTIAGNALAAANNALHIG